MQTFVPIDSFLLSAQILDKRRLQKQLLEGRQIYNILSSGRTEGGWVRHPAVLMWKNYDMALFSYLEAIKDECVNRGIKTDKNWNAILDMHESNWDRGDKIVMPAWWGDDRVHLSHRQNLFAKDPEYYADFAYDASLPKSHCCDSCNYFWSSHTLMYNSDLFEDTNA